MIKSFIILKKLVSLKLTYENCRIFARWERERKRDRLDNDDPRRAWLEQLCNDAIAVGPSFHLTDRRPVALAERLIAAACDWSGSFKVILFFEWERRNQVERDIEHELKPWKCNIINKTICLIQSNFFLPIFNNFQSPSFVYSSSVTTCTFVHANCEFGYNVCES